MALTLQQAKDYLRVQGAAEDTLIADLIVRATAKVKGALGRSIELVDRTFTDYGDMNRTYGVLTNLMIPLQFLPCIRADGSATTAPIITDAEGTVLDPAVDYYVGSPWDAIIRARAGIAFPSAPYTVDVQCGLEAAADYADVIEPSLDGAVLDVVSDDYQRRSPNASSESTGGGVSTSYHASGIPMRAWQQIQQWAVIRV